MAIPFVTPWSFGGEISHDNEPSLVMDMVEQYQVADLVRGPGPQVHIGFDRGGMVMIGSMRILTGKGRAVQFDGVLMDRAAWSEGDVLRAFVGFHRSLLGWRDRSAAGAGELLTI